MKPWLGWIKGQGAGLRLAPSWDYRVVTSFYLKHGSPVVVFGSEVEYPATSLSGVFLWILTANGLGWVHSKSVGFFDEENAP